MQLSKKSRYGLRALIDLASAPQNQYVSLSNIAERGEIPAQFLEQVFASFRRAGLVKALKGPPGRLSACPESQIHYSSGDPGDPGGFLSDSR